MASEKFRQDCISALFVKNSSRMRKPGLGEPNLGAVSGAATGAIGGLFAVGLVPAIMAQDIALLMAAPRVNMLCWLAGGLIGWFIGGQVGPRLSDWTRSRQMEIVGGIASGLLPVIGIVLWGWHMATS